MRLAVINSRRLALVDERGVVRRCPCRRRPCRDGGGRMTLLEEA